jgi:hypothetical protein
MSEPSFRNFIRGQSYTFSHSTVLRSVTQSPGSPTQSSPVSCASGVREGKLLPAARSCYHSIPTVSPPGSVSPSWINLGFGTCLPKKRYQFTLSVAEHNANPNAIAAKQSSTTAFISCITRQSFSRSSQGSIRVLTTSPALRAAPGVFQEHSSGSLTG